jgi:hypothetical protein
MKPEGWLPNSQVPATCLYPEPAQSSSNPHIHHFLKIHLNIIFQSTPGSPQWFLFLRFPQQNTVHTSPLPHSATCPAHLIILDFITRTTLGENYRSWTSSLWSFLHSPVTSSLLSPNILLNTLFWNTQTLNVSDQVSHLYKTTGKGIVLCILNFQFLDSKLEDKRFCTEW